jgi:UrcA family protein
MTKLFAATALAAMTIVAGSSAKAETQGLRVVSTTLSYETQDLANPAGATKMLGRIELAARKLCASASPAEPVNSRSVLSCRRAAVARAVDTLAAPLVSAAYAGHRPIDLASR